MTAPSSIEDLLKQCSSVYKLVTVAAMRAKELAAGAPSLVARGAKKATTTALEELVQGKIQLPTEETETDGKPKAKRGKTEKRKKS